MSQALATSNMASLAHRRYGKSEFQLKMEAARDIAPLTEKCLWCDWTSEGTAGEGRLEALAHRTAEHGWKPKKRRKR